MKHALLVSLSLNAVLLLLTGWMLWQQPRHDQGLVPQAHPAAPASAAPAVPAPTATAFHWREIESPDYPVFIANLRAIGCPEHTIRHLVDGELRAIYAEKASAVTSGPASDAAAIEQERLVVLDQLLQPASNTPADARGTVSSSVPENSTHTTPASPPALQPAATALIDSIPAAFLVGDDGAALTEGQLSTMVTDDRLAPEDAAQIARLRQEFEANVLPQGEMHLSPDSPEYRRLWRRAQQENDDRFSSLYGGDALDALYRQRLLQTSQASTTGSK